MRRLQPVIWAKGTFLSPQHLQAQDIFHEDLLQFRTDALNSFPWGFRTLTIDREALAAGNFAIDSASGIFPDGLIFEIPESDTAPPQKPLGSYFEPTHDTIDVHLAVPAWRNGNVNVATANTDADTRYLAEVTLMRDENASQIERRVKSRARISACWWTAKRARACQLSRLPASRAATAVSCNWTQVMSRRCWIFGLAIT